MKSRNKKTLVFGASAKPVRYSYKAIMMLDEYGHDIEAIGGKSSDLGGLEIQTGHPELKDVHTITMYMGEDRQADHEDYILSLKPKRIIFNPGAENMGLYFKARSAGIDVINACTLVMLRTDQY